MSNLHHDATERIEKLLELLDVEARACRQRDQDARAGKSGHALEQEGLRLRRAILADERAGLFGRSVVTFGEDPNRPGHVSLFAARPGAVVRVVEPEGEGPVGVVIRSGRGRLRVVFDEPPDLDPGGVDLELSSDEVTARRLSDALQSSLRTTGRSARLIERLLGAYPPGPSTSGALELLDEALNDDQRIGVAHGVFAPDVALIHGPPGTGKTRALVEVVRQCVSRSERVLCLAASNAAVDNLAIGVIEADPSVELVRTGHPARVNEALEAHTLAALSESHEQRRTAKRLVNQAFDLLRGARRRSDRSGDGWDRRKQARRDAKVLFSEARARERRATEAILDRAAVVAGTLTGYANELPKEMRFDVAVIDEASLALTPAVLAGIARAKRVVLAGDHMQLPPTVISADAAKSGLADTVFGALMREDAAYAHMLTVQHRMHQSLMHFPSSTSYGGRLVAHESVASRTLAPSDDSLTLPSRPLDVIDLAGAGYDEVTNDGASRANPSSAALVARVVERFTALDVSADDIGVITPYSAQVAEIVRRVEGVEVDSVDGFQGREKDVIIFDAVRSNAVQEVGFLSDGRRLNVAITRAKRKLIIIADSATLSVNSTWQRLFDHAMSNDAYRSVFELPEPD